MMHPQSSHLPFVALQVCLPKLEGCEGQTCLVQLLLVGAEDDGVALAQRQTMACF